MREKSIEDFLTIPEMNEEAAENLYQYSHKNERKNN